MAKYQIEEWDGSKDVVEAGFYDDLRQEPWVKAVDITYPDGAVHSVTEDYFYKQLKPEQLPPELPGLTDDQLIDKHLLALMSLAGFADASITFFEGRLHVSKW